VKTLAMICQAISLMDASMLRLTQIVHSTRWFGCITSYGTLRNSYRSHAPFVGLMVHGTVGTIQFRKSVFPGNVRESACAIRARKISEMRTVG